MWQDDDTLVKRHLTHKSLTSPQVTLATFEKQTFLSKITPKQVDIIHFLQSGYYPALVARRLNVSRSYVSRFVNKLLGFGLITYGYKDPLQNRATVYDVSKELATYIARFDKSEENKLTLCTPHNVRFKRHIISQSVPISTNLTRFAHAKFKFIKSYTPKGGERYVFEMKGTHGRYRAIVHPSSVEIMCVDRNYIPAKDPVEATNILSMSLQDAYTQFTSEQRWCGCRIELDEPVLVGSPHYVFKSADLKKVVNEEGTLKKVGTFEIDKSPEATGDTKHVEFESQDESQVVKFDKALHTVMDIDKIVPALVKEELKSVAEQIAGINDIAAKVDATANNVQALCQSGLPLANQFSQIQTVVAQQSRSINLMQESMLGIIANMSKILDKMEIKE
jgi:DNA-binding MarR family transcriptional regulator